MPKFLTFLWTLIVTLFYAVVFIAIPYLILQVPGARQGISTFLHIDPVSLELGLRVFGIAFIVLHILKNFTRRGTIINLVSGLALFGTGLVFLFYLGTFNASGPRLGFLSLSETLGGFSITGSFEYLGVALIWITITGLRSFNHILGFIDARRAPSSLRLPPPLGGWRS